MRFKSKKNLVFLENGVVVKEFKDEAALKREAETLLALKAAGLAVPSLLNKEGKRLFLEYIPGETYEALVEEMDFEKADSLARWLVDYHRITNSLRGDVNLRNFIWSKAGCLGVDFEEVPQKGEGETDMGRIVAFAVTYSPAFSPGKLVGGGLFLTAFLKRGGRKDKIRQAYLEEIIAMNQRRSAFWLTKKEALEFFDCLVT